MRAKVGAGRKVSKKFIGVIEDDVWGTVGRVTVKLRLGVGKYAKPRLESINKCKTDAELCKTMGELRAWTVTIRSDKEEEKSIPRNGYCGYIAMDQLMRDKECCNNVNENVGRMEICESARKLVNGSKLNVRDGWRGMELPERNGKERRPANSVLSRPKASARTGKYFATFRRRAALAEVPERPAQAVPPTRGLRAPCRRASGGRERCAASSRRSRRTAWAEI